jgi:hypothetical protein
VPLATLLNFVIAELLSFHWRRTHDRIALSRISSASFYSKREPNTVQIARLRPAPAYQRKRRARCAGLDLKATTGFLLIADAIFSWYRGGQRAVQSTAPDRR